MFISVIHSCWTSSSCICCILVSVFNSNLDSTHFRNVDSWCNEEDYETRDCQVVCPSDCRLSSWSPWTPCNAACGPGIQRRHRNVIQASLPGQKQKKIRFRLCFFIPPRARNPIAQLSVGTCRNPSLGRLRLCQLRMNTSRLAAFRFTSRPIGDQDGHRLHRINPSDRNGESKTERI